MSHFLKNLIYRNQAGIANPEARTIVQPRPRSMFESTTHVGSPIAQHGLDTELMKTGVSRPSPVIPKLRPHDQTKTDKNNPATHRQLDDENNFISTLSQREAQQFISQQTPRLKSQIVGHAESVSKTEPSSPPDKRTDAQTFSASEELNQRIQTILQHLNTQQTQRAGDPSSAEIHQHIAFLNAADALDIKAPSESPFVIEPAANVAQTDRMKEHNIENRVRQRETHQRGSLQTPNWLTEMQSAINSRLREMNSQHKPEPIVNVTIGRVEVRAVQTDSIKQSKPQNKPSGIMSLDDYLEQRNKGQS